MPAYTNNLRLREITTGDESGTWGDTTNSNLELIADAFGTGTEGLSGTTHTTEIANSPTADEGRALYLKYTGALGANNTVTLAPNDVNKLWIIENATTDSGSSGPYSIIIKQGTGDTVTIPNGKVAVVYADGAGSAADVKEAFANLKIGPSLTVGNAAAEDTKIVFDGNAQDYYVGLDDTDDDLKIGLGSTVGTTPAITIDENQDTTITQDLIVSGVGPHAIGGAVSSARQIYIQGSFAGNLGVQIASTLAPDAGEDSHLLITTGTITEAGSGTHALLSGAKFLPPTITGGSATVTNAATVYISDATAASGATNYALWVDAGAVQFDSTLGVGGALTAAGNIEVAKAAAKVIVDSSSTASIDIDRSATTEGAKVNFQTAGSSTWTIGMQDSDDWGDGTPFFMGTGSSADNAKFCMNTSGTITLGTVTPDVLYTLTPRLQVETTGSNAGLSAWRNSNDAGGAYLFLGKSRGTSVNSDTIVQDDDALGSIMFMAADGTDRGNAAASILANIDGTPGGNDTPGRLTFNTSADGSGSPTTRMTILSDGKIGIGANLSKEFNLSNGPNGLENVLHFEADGTTKWAMYGYDRTNSHYTDLSLSGGLIYMDKANDRVGIGDSSPSYKLEVAGTFHCTGALSKGSGSFKIDHPLPDKKDTHHLVHSFIEGPQADLIYRGSTDLVSGWVQVDLDEAAGMSEGTFEVLCRDAQCFIQNDSGWDAVRGAVEGNTLSITCADSDSDDTVSWMVVAERCDPHILDTNWTDDDGHVIVEPEKPEEEE